MYVEHSDFIISEHYILRTMSAWAGQKPCKTPEFTIR